MMKPILSIMAIAMILSSVHSNIAHGQPGAQGVSDQATSLSGASDLLSEQELTGRNLVSVNLNPVAIVASAPAGKTRGASVKLITNADPYAVFRSIPKTMKQYKGFPLSCRGLRTHERPLSCRLEWRRSEGGFGPEIYAQPC